MELDLLWYTHIHTCMHTFLFVTVLFLFYVYVYTHQPYFDHVITSSSASSLLHASAEIFSSIAWNPYLLTVPDYPESWHQASKAIPREDSFLAWTVLPGPVQIPCQKSLLPASWERPWPARTNHLFPWVWWAGVPPCACPRRPPTGNLGNFSPDEVLCHSLTWW